MRFIGIILVNVALVGISLAKDNFKISLPQVEIIVNDSKNSNEIDQCSKRYSENSCKGSFAGSVCANGNAQGVCAIKTYKNKQAICQCAPSDTVEIFEVQEEGYTCDNSNVYGSYPEGGGCNAYGCYEPGGGCNAYGCYEKGGDCTPYGCHAEGGSCSAFKCIKKRESKKLMCQEDRQ